jgi:hypothetical protein
MGTPLAGTIAGLWLSSIDALLPWFVGQIILAAALVQWFVVLHECGHGTLFETAWLNALATAAGFFALIPFESWKRYTTGTTSGPAGRIWIRRRRYWRPRLQEGSSAAVNVCWKYWIPLFSVLY